MTIRNIIPTNENPIKDIFIKLNERCNYTVYSDDDSEFCEMCNEHSVIAVYGSDHSTIIFCTECDDIPDYLIRCFNCRNDLSIFDHNSHVHVICGNCDPNEYQYMMLHATELNHQS